MAGRIGELPSGLWLAFVTLVICQTLLVQQRPAISKGNILKKIIREENAALDLCLEKERNKQKS